MKTLIKNARIISPGIDLPGAAVEIEGTVITAVYPAGSELPAVDKVVDNSRIDQSQLETQRTQQLQSSFPDSSTSTATAPAAAIPATPSWKACAPSRNAK